MMNSLKCGVCGGIDFSQGNVLWDSLITEWELSEYETEYINRQQGKICNTCGSNLRSIVLANAIRSFLGTKTLLKDIPTSYNWNDTKLKSIRILEINEAGMLTRHLKGFQNYTFASYPEVDIHSMSYPDNSFDLVVHSDTLEHVQDPIKALAECRRVLKTEGALCFTVPIVVGRLSRSRDGLPKSYHGTIGLDAEDFVVHTEFGVDAWTYLMKAGFSNISIISLDYPDAIAFVAKK